MADEIPWALVAEWEAFFDAEPTADERGDWQAASITSAIYNTRAYPSPGSKPIEIEDCVAYLSSMMRKNGEQCQ